MAANLPKPRIRGPDPIDVAVGEKIKIRRRLLAISQSELGKALGVSFQQIQKYEKGTNRIGASRLQHIAAVLHVQPAYFFPDGGADTGRVPELDAELSRFIASDDGRDLYRAFARIGSPPVRRKIVVLVESIAAQSGRSE